MGIKGGLLRFSSFWLFPLLSVILLRLTYDPTATGQLRSLVWLVLGGLLVWTVLEYFLHRLVFHVRLQNPRFRAVLNASHGRHHSAPRDPDSILVNSFSGVVISLGLFAILVAITGSLFSAAGVLTGIWIGFLYYEFVHYRVHMSIGDSRLLQWQRRAHFYHHFSNPQRCFGVTTPLWDYVFGTKRLVESKSSRT